MSLRGLVGGQGDDLQTLGISQHLDTFDSWFDGVGSDTDVGTDDGPILSFPHLADALYQIVRPLHLLYLDVVGRPSGELFQVLHGHKVVNDHLEEALELFAVAVFFGHFLQVKVAVLRRRELVLQDLHAGHGPHQVGCRAQAAKAVADAALPGV